MQAEELLHWIESHAETIVFTAEDEGRAACFIAYRDRSRVGAVQHIDAPSLTEAVLRAAFPQMTASRRESPHGTAVRPLHIGDYAHDE